MNPRADVTPVVPFQRSEMVERLRDASSTCWSIGGGITGAGVALDAATRGLRTALVERDDFASGTSSKSSKLVHGGLRYLQQGDVRLVYEALHERQRLRRNAPHLVTRAAVPDPDPHQGRPCLDARSPGRSARRCGCTTSPAAARIGKLHRRLKADAAFAHLPTLPDDRLASALPLLRRRPPTTPASC